MFTPPFILEHAPKVTIDDIGSNLLSEEAMTLNILFCYEEHCK
jgi:hypothetical protein